MHPFRLRAIGYGLILLFTTVCLLPNLLPQTWQTQLPPWYANSGINLGLDLRGGSQLLLAADTQALLSAEYEGLSDELRSRLRQASIGGVYVKAAADHVAIAIIPTGQQAKNNQVAEVVNGLAATYLQGKGHFDVNEKGNGDLTLQLSKKQRLQLTSEAMERSLEVVRRRLNESGLVEPSVTRQGESRILVQMPGVSDPTQVRQLLGKTAALNFHWLPDNNPSQSHGKVQQATMQVPGNQPGEIFNVLRKPSLAGTHIQDADLAFDQTNQQPVVNFSLDAEGARQFAEMTKHNIGRALAIVLDGQVITAPVIQGVIGNGSGQISGHFTSEEASELALLLRAGALPVPLQVLEERTVGPELGSDAIAMGLITGLVGAALVLAFLVFIYGAWGLVPAATLLINMSLLFGALSFLDATLTLPGIAGIVLTIGMAVDGNILIMERIREESRRHSSAGGALRAGFAKAHTAIIDSNITTLIAVSLLFLFGSGPVRGFAVTIGIGLITTLFSSVAVNRFILEWLLRKRGRRGVTINGLAWMDRLRVRSFDVLRGRFMGLMVSAVLSLGSVVLLFQPGLNYGVDFTGGVMVEVAAGDVASAQIRQQLQHHGLADAALQESGTDGHFLVRLPAPASASTAANDGVAELKSAIKSIAPQATFPKVDMVGPKVSGDFALATLTAIILAGVGMAAYLWLRFESQFALAAAITIALDLTKTVGFFALTGIEFNLTAVAALLALMGYSINDKVIIFDRLRENLLLEPNAELIPLMNRSISSTLSRTLYTSATTALALLPMAIWGGLAVRSFAVPMLFGVVIGTSSSILIASPIVYFISRQRQKRGWDLIRMPNNNDEEPALP